MEKVKDTDRFEKEDKRSFGGETFSYRCSYLDIEGILNENAKPGEENAQPGKTLNQIEVVP